MSSRDDLHRLAEARPAILDHTHLVMDAAQEERVLAEILLSPRPAPRTSRRRAPHLPHRPATIASLAAAVTAGVAVAATLVAGNIGHLGVPGPAAGSHGQPGTRRTGTGHPAKGSPVIDANLLAQRTTLAVTAASQDIEYTRVTYAVGTAGQVATLQLWTYGLLTQEYATTADGSPDMRMSGVVIGSTRYRRFIDYASRTWQEDSIPASEVGQLPANWISVKVRQMINGAAGPAQVQHEPEADRPSVRYGTLPDGERVVIATSQPWTYEGAHGATPIGGGTPVPPPLPLPELANPEFIPPQTGPPLAVRTTVVIDASTYLPLQVILTATDGRVIESQSFAWLPATAANLAPLEAQVPVPPGFTQTG